MCFLAGPNVQQLHSSQCCAFSLSSQYPSFIIQSMSFCLGLPLPLFPSILPSIITLCRELPLRMCSIQFFCLVLIYIKIYKCINTIQYSFHLAATDGAPPPQGNGSAGIMLQSWKWDLNIRLFSQHCIRVRIFYCNCC